MATPQKKIYSKDGRVLVTTPSPTSASTNKAVYSNATPAPRTVPEIKEDGPPTPVTSPTPPTLATAVAPGAGKKKKKKNKGKNGKRASDDGDVESLPPSDHSGHGLELGEAGSYEAQESAEHLASQNSYPSPQSREKSELQFSNRDLPDSHFEENDEDSEADLPDLIDIDKINVDYLPPISSSQHALPMTATSSQQSSQPSNTASKKSKKKKKNKGGNGQPPIVPFTSWDPLRGPRGVNGTLSPNPAYSQDQRSWSSGSGSRNNNSSNQAVSEKEQIKEFWLSLNEEERKNLVRIEKETVLRKMKDGQSQKCTCTVCGRKRIAIEEELEVLYDNYFDELEQYASNQNSFQQSPALGPYGPERPPPLIGAYPDDEDDLDEDDYDEGSDDEGDDDEDYSDDVDDEDDPDAPDYRKNFFHFGRSLQVKGGMLSVADDLMKNDGKKFIEMMEKLADRRIQKEEEALREAGEYEDDLDEPDDYDDEDDEYDDDEEEDSVMEEQRMQEGRRMFQVFAARMFEQRVFTAYREKVAQERQAKLLEELEDEERKQEQKDAKKAKEKEKKKEKARLQKEAKEQERLKKEAEFAEAEKKRKEQEDKKNEEQRKKKEEQRLKREEEKKRADTERARKEDEKRKRQAEERERQAEAEKRRQAEAEDKRKRKEENQRKEREAKEAKDREAREKREIRERELRELEKQKRAEDERMQKEKVEVVASARKFKQLPYDQLRLQQRQLTPPRGDSPQGPAVPKSGSNGSNGSSMNVSTPRTPINMPHAHSPSPRSNAALPPQYQQIPTLQQPPSHISPQFHSHLQNTGFGNNSGVRPPPQYVLADTSSPHLLPQGVPMHVPLQYLQAPRQGPQTPNGVPLGLYAPMPLGNVGPGNGHQFARFPPPSHGMPLLPQQLPHQGQAQPQQQQPFNSPQLNLVMPSGRFSTQEGTPSTPTYPSPIGSVAAASSSLGTTSPSIGGLAKPFAVQGEPNSSGLSSPQLPASTHSHSRKTSVDVVELAAPRPQQLPSVLSGALSSQQILAQPPPGLGRAIQRPNPIQRPQSVVHSDSPKLSNVSSAASSQFLKDLDIVTDDGIDDILGSQALLDDDDGVDVILDKTLSPLARGTDPFSAIGKKPATVSSRRISGVPEPFSAMVSPDKVWGPPAGDVFSSTLNTWMSSPSADRFGWGSEDALATSNSAFVSGNSLGVWNRSFSPADRQSLLGDRLKSLCSQLDSMQHVPPIYTLDDLTNTVKRQYPADSYDQDEVSKAIDNMPQVFDLNQQNGEFYVQYLGGSVSSERKVAGQRMMSTVGGPSGQGPERSILGSLVGQL